MRKLFEAVALAILLSSCTTTYGHWGSYVSWNHNCPEFPSREEVERVLQENTAVIERLQKEELIWSADVNECPQGAFITLLHGGEWQKEPVLKILDEVGARQEGLNRFFGIPFRFLNV